MKSLVLGLTVLIASNVSFGATSCYLNGKQLARTMIPGGTTLHNLKVNGLAVSAVIDSSGLIQQMAIQDLEKQVQVFSNAKIQESDLSYVASQSVILACLNK